MQKAHAFAWGASHEAFLRRRNGRRNIPVVHGAGQCRGLFGPRDHGAVWMGILAWLGNARAIAMRECVVRTPRYGTCYIMYCRSGVYGLARLDACAGGFFIRQPGEFEDRFNHLPASPIHRAPAIWDDSRARWPHLSASIWP